MSFGVRIIIVLLVAASSSVGCHTDESAQRPPGDLNAVDSVVQPETDMRQKTHRSQELPSKLGETESEEKGDIGNGNSA